MDQSQFPIELIKLISEKIDCFVTQISFKKLCKKTFNEIEVTVLNKNVCINTATFQKYPKLKKISLQCEVWGEKSDEILEISSNEIKYLDCSCSKKCIGCEKINNCINRLTNLEYLNINNLDTIVDLSGLTKLKKLICSNLNYEVYPDLSTLTNLTYLSCNSYYLWSNFPGLSNLTKLLVLKCNGVQILQEDIAKLTNLTKLSCNGMKIEIDISNLTNLKSLSCSYTEIDVSNLVNLTKLNISNNQNITDISMLSGLTKLDCGGDSGIADHCLKKMVNLKKLNISHNQKISDYGLGFLTGLKNLTAVQNMYISGKSIDKLKLDEFVFKGWSLMEEVD